MVGKFKKKAQKIDQKFKNRMVAEEIPVITNIDVQNPVDFMVQLDPQNISGIGEIRKEQQSTQNGSNVQDRIIYRTKNGIVFLVAHESTLEVRTESKLNNTLREKYETVMESRYFGQGGIEVVPSGQLTESEIEDLIRLSYNLSSTTD